ncbi:MAG: SCO1664 family protein [Dehalococcoidia bacterium]|nr:SCO1664 family protein [Dehalococcoidia bacterium]
MINDFLNQDIDNSSSNNQYSLDEKLDFLANAEIVEINPIYRGSNYVYLTLLKNHKSQKMLSIYKPVDGLQPLFDFDITTLPDRELSAFVLDQLLGWNLIPAIVIRNGPLGVGSLQEFIYHDPNNNYFDFINEPAHHPSLLQIAVFDLLANNADRKGGHVIQDSSKNFWAIDNALSFHTEEKLRTVIWDFAEKKIPDNLISDIKVLSNILESNKNKLSSSINQLEIESLLVRCNELACNPIMPKIYPWRCWPWPLI